MTRPLGRFGVAGVGLIGASLGLRARALGTTVVGYDTNARALALARECGAIDESAKSFAELFANVETLALAGPLEATIAQLHELATLPPSPCRLIFDVASVKEPVSRAGAGIATFVATHPIAGSERSGPLAGRADLFEGRKWTVDANAPAAAREAVEALVAAFGAHALAIDSAEHDRTIALTSHLPQILSVALGTLLAPRLDDAKTRELCGTGIRSMLRLGGSSWPMWRAVLDANSVSVAQEVRRLAAILTVAAESLETHSVDALEARFTSANAAVARLSDVASEPKGAS